MPKIKVLAIQTVIPVQGESAVVEQGKVVDVTDNDLAKIKEMGYVGFTVEVVEAAPAPQKGKGK